MVFEIVVGCTVFVDISIKNTYCSSWVPITPGNIDIIMGSIMRIIIRIVGRIIIVKINITTNSTHLEGVSRRGGVEVSVTVLGIDDGSVAGLCFDVKTVQ